MCTYHCNSCVHYLPSEVLRVVDMLEELNQSLHRRARVDGVREHWHHGAIDLIGAHVQPFGDEFDAHLFVLLEANIIAGAVADLALC
jgi:hypothetical protein